MQLGRHDELVGHGVDGRGRGQQRQGHEEVLQELKVQSVGWGGGNGGRSIDWVSRYGMVGKGWVLIAGAVLVDRQVVSM